MRRFRSEPGFWSDVALAFTALALVLRLAIPPGMMVYPRMTALDLIGPQYMFASLMGAKVHLVARSM
jgi:hypothetical protein